MKNHSIILILTLYKMEMSRIWTQLCNKCARGTTGCLYEQMFVGSHEEFPWQLDHLWQGAGTTCHFLWTNLNLKEPEASVIRPHSVMEPLSHIRTVSHCSASHFSWWMWIVSEEENLLGGVTASCQDGKSLSQLVRLTGSFAGVTGRTSWRQQKVHQ